MTTTICGNCTHYARDSAWSGACSQDEQHRSPGMPCTIAKFEALPSMRESKPAGSYPQALLASGVSDINMQTGAFSPSPPVLVEVLAIVGQWAMVRWPPDESGQSVPFGMEHLLHLRREGEPFVVEAVRLDFGTSRQ